MAGTSPAVSAAKRRRLEALERTMQAARGQRSTATPSSSTAQRSTRPPRSVGASRAAPPTPPPDTADAATYAPLPGRLLTSGPVAHMLKTLPPPFPTDAPVLRATLAALAATRSHAAASTSLPPVRVPDKPLLLDNPTALLPGATPRAVSRGLPRPQRAAIKAGSAVLNAGGKVDAAAVARVQASWSSTVADAVARDGATSATLHTLTIAGAPIRVTRAADGRHAGVEGVLVGASASAWRVATHSGRVVRVSRPGTALWVTGPGIKWCMES